MEYDSGIPENAAHRLQELLSRRELIIQKRTKRKDMADVDIAPMILQTDWREGENALIGTVLVQAQNPGLNPQLLEKAVGGTPRSWRRTSPGCGGWSCWMRRENFPLKMKKYLHSEAQM